VNAKCPGRDGRLLTASDVTCPNCGVEVEFFSDEQRRKCPSCGERVARDAVPACAAWCASASSCLGADRYAAALNSGLLGERSGAKAGGDA
jgi:Fe-S-cluster-containing dehydrogenase component